MPRVNHFEIVAKDTEKIIEFYKKTFGWKITKWDGPIDYWMINTGDDEEGINGGLALKETNDANITVNTIGVKDIDIAIKAITTNGGKIITPKQMIPGVGWIAYFQDPEGTNWGIMQEVPQE